MPSTISTAALVLLTFSSLTSALAVHNPSWARQRTPSPEELFGRDSTCGESSYVQCSADLPSDFCCPSTSTCMVLAGKTTVLCCPTGGDCSQIEPIPCDLSLEDKSLHSAATVMTSALTGTLETCADKCCPFGYSCSDDGVCNLDSDQSAKPSTSSVASSATATSSQSSTETQTAGVNPTTATDSSSTATSTSGASSSSGSSTATAAAETTSAAAGTGIDTSDNSEASSTNAGLVAGGVVGGLAGLVLLGLLILFLVKRERKRKALAQKGGDDDSRASSSFGNFGTAPHPEISKPIVSETGTWRSDFTRKVSVREPGSLHSHGNGPGGRIREEDEDDDEHDGVSYIEELDDDVSSLHQVPHSPPRLTVPSNERAVSSMYGSFYDPNDPAARQSAYLQAPLKMPSARAYGGNDSRVSVGRDWLGDPLSEYNSNDVSRAGSRQETDAAYIDVFADSNALAPPPLGFGERERRETRFSDFGRQA